MIEGLARRALKKESKVEFPDDADGDALRRVQANGSNMASRPFGGETEGWGTFGNKGAA